MTTSPKTAVGLAHSKLILVGEHAVVYGKPAIAIPFPLEVKAVIEETSGKMLIDCAYYAGPILQMPKQLQGIAACIRETLMYLNKPFQGLHIRINSTIPLGRGLGSSAAIAVAVVKSIFAFYRTSLSQKELISLVKIAETYAHGTPSGIDMAAVATDLPIWFQKGQNVRSLHISHPVHIVVADSGVTGDTRVAVGLVREKYLHSPEKTIEILDTIERLTNDAKAAILEGDAPLLGSLLSENHVELMKLGVSNGILNQLVVSAKKAGALGAKLTGGGLGGCIISLAKNPEQAQKIATKLKSAGAINSWCFTTVNV